VLWPDHAIQGSPNAALHRGVDLTRVEVIIRKGFDRAIDSYSTFFENDRSTATGLDGWLRQRGFRRVFLAGLATEDACRGIGVPVGGNRTTLDVAREHLTKLGVGSVTSARLGA
jgi:nicotinamidase/pyrazinamidase